MNSRLTVTTPDGRSLDVLVHGSDGQPTVFFHHGTYTNSHGDHPKVNRLQGASQKYIRMRIFKQHCSPTTAPIKAETRPACSKSEVNWLTAGNLLREARPAQPLKSMSHDAVASDGSILAPSGP